MPLGFLKEQMLNQVSTLGNLETLQYLGQSVYLLPLLLVLFVPLTLSIIIYLSTKRNYWGALIVSELLRFILVTMIIMGLLPLWLTLN